MYLLRNPQGCFIHEEIFSQTLLLFPVLGLLSQQAALSLCKTGTHYIPSSCLPHPMWVPLSRRKAPIVELCYQIQRLIDINKGNENTLAVVIVHTFLWASEILMIRHLKVNIFTTLEKQTIFKNPLGLSCHLPELLSLKLFYVI